MTTQTELSTAAQAIIDAGMAAQADVLLSAIKQRDDDRLIHQSILSDHSKEIHRLQSELAPYIAALEAGRKDRPEVDRIRNDRASSNPEQEDLGWQYAYNSQGTLLSAIDELHLTEAALRVACDHKQEVIDGMQQEIIDLQSYKSLLPADWSKDSSLETWFPVTASMLERLQRELDHKQEVLAGVQVVLNERTELLDRVQKVCDIYYQKLQEREDLVRALTVSRDAWMTRALAAEAMVNELKRSPVDARDEQIRVMRKALQTISKWQGEFPDTGRTWDDGSPMSYGACFGSNGERDFMRNIAAAALACAALAQPQLIDTDSAVKIISASAEEDYKPDALRYARLRIHGVAPYGTQQLDAGTVLRFTNLDEFVDALTQPQPTDGEQK